MAGKKKKTYVCVLDYHGFVREIKMPRFHPIIKIPTIGIDKFIFEFQNIRDDGKYYYRQSLANY